MHISDWLGCALAGPVENDSTSYGPLFFVDGVSRRREVAVLLFILPNLFALQLLELVPFGNFEECRHPLRLLGCCSAPPWRLPFAVRGLPTLP